jgi:Fur family transcriptional regulator, ferric uptake regulator
MSQDWASRLQERGYRRTAQRQLVAEAVARLGHATPEDVCAEVRRTAAGVNLSTIYRTLDLLEKIGLVTHTHLGHGAPTYHAASVDEHLHLVCSECGRVTETSPDAARELVARLHTEHGFETDVRHVAVHGRCAACAAAT